MGRVLPVVVAIALLVYALIDCLQTDSGRIRLNRFVWLAVIVVIPVIGPILWIVLGKIRERRGPARPAAPQLPPDDDPEFLRQLRESDSRHEKMLGQWEADLRKREGDIRRRTEPDQPDSPSSSRGHKDGDDARRREEELRQQHGDDEDDAR